MIPAGYEASKPSVKSNKRKLGIIVISICFLLASMSLFAQDAKESKDLLNRKVSLNAEDAPLSNVIATLASLSDCNIVLSVETGQSGSQEQQQEKKITINVKNLPIEQALSLVVKASGLSYRLVGENTFLVGEKARISEEVGERSFIVNLNNVNAEKIAKSFADMGGKVTAIEGQNALMISANPETYAEISKRVEELDTPQKQIQIRARLIEISINDTKKLGIDWSRLNHLTTILAEDPVNANGVGLPYSFSDETGALPFGNAEDFEKLPETQYFQKLDGWDNVGHFSRQLTAFDITIDWLLQNNAAKLLTDAHVTALNGEEAEIFIGEVIPFVVTDNDKQVQVEREETGIKLTILPVVNADGMITAKINPEVSSVTDLVGGYVPRTKQRRVNSTVTVPNGEKILVGGLLSSNLFQTVNKVPILGDIPFIGALFRHKVEQLESTDLVIEITPRVINLAEEQQEFVLDERLTRELIERKTEDSENEEEQE
ncbi:MAG: secretin and TonB N-terminal domain-containing protein [Candidatus Cloacimonadales bacterium]|nr:secretin and TonB N-terminal domain-containing protein [Candidatus Cloacimonadota bacterium]MDX9977077.1 secretin and TonB N-terminal domain-containing protein [Candidatus Cloacimonadales bacterium]HQB64867.1 secretin and TonB N-terminal domain-containing protein [Fibrobacteraceae bacterium]